MTPTGRLSFLGAGTMGLPMVRRLVSAGWDVTSWSRDGETRELLEGVGAVVAASYGKAVDGSDTCVTCVFSEEHLRRLLVEEGIARRLAPGAVVVNHVTMSASGARRLATELSAHGRTLVDAPVSGTPIEIADGRLVVLLAGDDDAALTRAREVVSSYAGTMLRVGGVGSATALKLLNNALFAAQAQLTESALRVSDAWGLDRTAVIDVLSAGSGTNGALEFLRRSGSTSLDDTVRYLVKDVAAIRSDLVEDGIMLGSIDAAIRSGPMAI